MLHKKLIQPNNIVIIGGSDNVHSPGGKVLKNLIDHNFNGKLLLVNPKKIIIQGVKSYQNIDELPEVDLAIIAIAAKYILGTVKVLTQEKNTKGFIIYSAGFSEKNKKGGKIEHEIVSVISKAGGTLLGPNNIGLINNHYAGVFTSPIPKLNKKGVDLISGSGATAVFIMEAAQSTGLTFSSVYTVGNSAQIGVEEVLAHFDETYDKNKSSRVKLLYIESIRNPIKFLKHASSLVEKGCEIAAIKAGSSEEGCRAASSHTGAMANSDVFVEALFHKAGIIRCSGRIELITVAGILLQKESKGKNIAIITHAGGPAVILTDILSKNGMHVPKLTGKISEGLLNVLYDGSSVTNPIDFLATGTSIQLELIIDYCENRFDSIDAMAVIFGSPGLNTVHDAYAVLHKKIKSCKKPIYAILPSVVNVKEEIIDFTSKGNIAFTDEVLFGRALAKVNNAPKYIANIEQSEGIDVIGIRKIIDGLPNGYAPPETVDQLLKLTEVNFVDQWLAKDMNDLLQISASLKYPVVMKVAGILHKSDVGGILLNISNEEEVINAFRKLMLLEGVKSVIIQPMEKGIELFIGAKKEGTYPPIIMCGLGGIFVEFLKDISIKMIPVSKDESLEMITKLKTYPILKGSRGQKGIDVEEFAKTIRRIAQLLIIAPEISELDLNPLMAHENKITAVDARIKIEK